MQHLTRIKWFVLLVILQALVLNHVHFGRFATPLFYIYFILKFNSDTNTKSLILWGFSLGICIDILSNTPGLNAAATVFTAFCRPKLLHVLSTRDPDDKFEPGIRIMGLAAFSRYALAVIFLHSAALNIIDAFSFVNFNILILKILSDALMTLVCVLCIDSVRRER